MSVIAEVLNRDEVVAFARAAGTLVTEVEAGSGSESFHRMHLNVRSGQRAR
jgi:hypothetical protein